MTEDMYQTITQVARTFRAYRLMVDPHHPNKDAGDQLARDWPELWDALNNLQLRWLE